LAGVDPVFRSGRHRHLPPEVWNVSGHSLEAGKILRLCLCGGRIALLAFNAGSGVFIVPAVIALPKSGK
jgi:hypothetical protein